MVTRCFSWLLQENKNLIEWIVTCSKRFMVCFLCRGSGNGNQLTEFRTHAKIPGSMT